MGTDIIRVRQVMGKTVAQLEKPILDVFLSSGYKIVQGNLLKGDFVPDVFPRSRALAYMLHKQRIPPPTHFKHTLEAAQAMGGLCSDFEAGLRVNLFTPTWNLARAGVLIAGLGIPEHLVYCVPSDILLYKKAKDRPVEPDMKELMSVIPPYSPISRSELAQRYFDQGMGDAKNRVFPTLLTESKQGFLFTHATTEMKAVRTKGIETVTMNKAASR